MPQEDYLSTLLKGSGLILVGRIVKVVILFLVQVILARLLGTTGYGDYVLTLAIVTIGTIIGGIGLNSGLLRKIPAYEDDPSHARGIIFAGLALSLIASISTSILLFFAAEPLSWGLFQNPSLTNLFRVAAIAIPFSVLTQIGLSVARSSRDARPQFIVKQLIEPFAKLILGAGLVLLGFHTLGAVVGVVQTTLITALVASYLAYRSLSFDLQGPSPSKYKELLLFSFPLMMSSSIFFIIQNSDTFIIGVFSPATQVGIYNAAFQLRTVGMFFFHPFTFLLPPVITRLQKKNEEGNIKTIYQAVTKWMTVITLPVFFAAMFFSETLVTASFGSDYLTAVQPLKILLVSVLITVVLGGNEQALVALGYNHISLYVNTFAATLNVILNLLLIPNYGIDGAALATSISFIIRDFGFTLFLYRWERIHPLSSGQLKILSIFIMFGPLLYFIFIGNFGQDITTLFIYEFLLLLVMAPVVYILGLDRWDKQVIHQIYQKAQGKE